MKKTPEHLPGFTAEISLSEASYHYQASGGSDFAADGKKVLPQLPLRGIGFCMARCRQDDWLCLFGCLSAEQ